LIKVIFVAKKALAAYLVSSEVRRPTKCSGGWFRLKGRKKSRSSTSRAARIVRADHHPIGTL